MGVKFPFSFLLVLNIHSASCRKLDCAEHTQHSFFPQSAGFCVHPKAKSNAFDPTIFLHLCKYTGVLVLKLITMKATQVHRLNPKQTSLIKQKFRMSGILPKDTEQRPGW